MWVLKSELKHDCYISNRAHKFNVSIVGYPVKYTQTKEGVVAVHFDKIYGDKNNVKSYIKDINKEKQIINFENNGNVIFFQYLIDPMKKIPTMTENVFYIKPILVDNRGVEHWELASWSREELMKFYNRVKNETYELEFFKILKLKEEKIKDLYFPNVMPLLTEQQEKAILLAFEEGYYEFPRKIDLKKLSEISGLSLSAYREHLRKAEKKLLVVSLKNVI